MTKAANILARARARAALDQDYVEMAVDPAKVAEIEARLRYWRRVAAWPPLIAYPKIRGAVRRAAKSNDLKLHS